MKYAVVLILIAAAFFLMLPQPQAEFPSDSFVIRNVKLFDGEQVSENQDVVVSQGKIVKIGKDVTGVALVQYEGQGKTLLPGLIDAHTHVYGNALSEAINFGITTELDMFSMPQIINPLQQQRADSTVTNQADVFSATILATAPDGHGTEYGFKIPVLTGPQDAARFVDERIAQGSDYIKIVYDTPGAPFELSPSISYETMVELVKHSHRAGKMAVAHIDDLASAKAAVKAGIDGLIHSFMDAVADDELIDMMKQNQVFIIPTLVVEASLAQLPIDKNLFTDPVVEPYLSEEQLAKLRAPFLDLGYTPQDYEVAKQSIAKYHQAGITILAGSDAPNPGTAHGISLHKELALLVEAGMSELETLKAATGNVNKTFDIGYRGTIKQGQPATFLLVEGDPMANINYSKNIVAIWKHGQHVERIKHPKANIPSEPVRPGMIADFDDGQMKPYWGRQLVETADSIVGGKSNVQLVVTHSGFVQAKGEIKKGFAYPWAGMQFNMASSADLSGLSKLKFKAKGEIANLYIMLFQKGSYQPIMQAVTLDKQWQDYSIELTGFRNADLANVTALAWVAAQQPQAFEFALDDIELK